MRYFLSCWDKVAYFIRKGEHPCFVLSLKRYIRESKGSINMVQGCDATNSWQSLERSFRYGSFNFNQYPSTSRACLDLVNDPSCSSLTIPSICQVWRHRMFFRPTSWSILSMPVSIPKRKDWWACFYKDCACFFSLLSWEIPNIGNMAIFSCVCVWTAKTCSQNGRLWKC